MSEAAERPAEDRAAPSDADAWATACEEDLAAEKARRRERYGPQPTSAAEELRRLADAVSEKVAELGKPFGGVAASTAAQGVAQQLIAQAKAAIEPVVERNPQLFGHLAAAGNELLAAYHAAVQNAEQRWTTGQDRDREADPGEGGRPGDAGRAGPTGEGGRNPFGTERIDLDNDPDDPRGDGSGGPEGTGKP